LNATYATFTKGVVGQTWNDYDTDYLNPLTPIIFLHMVISRVRK